MERFVSAMNNFYALITDSLIASVATILVVVCGLYLAFGDTGKGKVYAFSIIFGISIIYGASSLVSAIWG